MYANIETIDYTKELCKMKKKIVAMICVLTCTASLVGCGKEADVKGKITGNETMEQVETVVEEFSETATVKNEPEASTEQETSTEQDEQETSQINTEEEIKLGHNDGNVYENEFLNIGCALGDTWNCLNDEQIRQINQISAELVGEEYQKVLENATVITDMQAVNVNQQDSLSVSLEKLAPVALLISDEQYLELSKNNLVGALENMGIQNINASISTTTFCNQEHYCLKVSGSISNVNVYEELIAIKKGRYVGCIAVCSWVEDKTDEYLGSFYTLN